MRIGWKMKQFNSELYSFNTKMRRLVLRLAEYPIFIEAESVIGWTITLAPLQPLNYPDLNVNDGPFSCFTGLSVEKSS